MFNRSLKFGIALLLLAIILSLIAIYPIEVHKKGSVKLSQGYSGSLPISERNIVYITLKLIDGGSVIVYSMSKEYTLNKSTPSLTLKSLPEKIIVEEDSAKLAYDAVCLSSPYQFLGALAFILMLTGSAFTIRGVLRLFQGITR